MVLVVTMETPTQQVDHVTEPSRTLRPFSDPDQTWYHEAGLELDQFLHQNPKESKDGAGVMSLCVLSSDWSVVQLLTWSTVSFMIPER